MLMNTLSVQSVLIVDKSAESREVLRTALSMRGVQTLEASGSRQGLDLLRSHHPHVVVLDPDVEGATDASFQAAWDEEVQHHPVSIIVLGKARWCADGLPEDQVVAKPYHYAPLIRKIEQLCQQAKITGGAP